MMHLVAFLRSKYFVMHVTGLISYLTTFPSLFTTPLSFEWTVL